MELSIATFYFVVPLSKLLNLWRTFVFVSDTDIFKIYAGVMQGNKLAPFLFALDCALRNPINGFEEELGLTLKRRQGRRVGAESLCVLDFADDIFLMSDAVNQAQELILRVERECKGVGLMLNSKKTKSMFLDVDVILQALPESLKISSTWGPGVTRIKTERH